MRVASFNCSSIVTNLRVVPTVSHRKVQDNSHEKRYNSSRKKTNITPLYANVIL